MKRVKVFLVDDHPMVREGLKAVLDNDRISVIGEAGTASEALKKLQHLSPDVALLDVRLPDRDGIELGIALKEKYPHLYICILTTYSDETMVIRATRAGIEGYLLKEIDPEKLCQSVLRIAQGHITLDDKANEILLKGLARESDSGLENRSRWKCLSLQEHKVAALVAEGLINKEIADRMGLSEKTIKNYLSTVFSKLNVSRRAQVASLYTMYAKP